MTCQENQIRISRLLDQELTEDESAPVLAHASTCPECRRFLHQTVAINESLNKQMSLAISGEDDAEHIQAPLRRPGVPGFLQGSRPRLSTFVMVVLISLFVGVLFSTTITASGQGARDNVATTSDVLMR